MDWKQLNEQKLSALHPAFADRVRRFLAYMEQQGIPILVTQGMRTWAEQDALYFKGRTIPPLGKKYIVTKARGGQSQHNFGLAVDLCPDDVTLAGLQLDWNIEHPVWKKMLAEAPQFKLAEGAKWRTFPDNPHFYPVEIPSTTAILRQQYAKGGVPQVWKWFGQQVQA